MRLPGPYKFITFSVFQLEAIAPASRLREVVEKYFITRATIPHDQPLEKNLLPSIMQSLLLNMNGNPQFISPPMGDPGNYTGHLILGQYTKPFTATLTGEIDFIGIHFTPTGLYRLLRRPAHQFANQVHEVMEESWKKFFSGIYTYNTSERIGAIDHWLQQMIAPPDPATAITREAANALVNARGAATIDSVGRQVGLSERSLQRYFLRHIGVSPKIFNRIVRFHSVTRLIESNGSVDWKNIFYETGYSDHAHFVKDFRHITGVSPTTYYRLKTGYEKFFYGS
jgi:AraC-like DNA-binding protein